MDCLRQWLVVGPVVFSILYGCADHGKHRHEPGPHGGHLIDLGGTEYHAELTFDPAAGTATVYLLDRDLTPLLVEVPQVELHLENEGDEVEVILAPAPMAGDAAGSWSRFVSAAADLPAFVKDIEDLRGHIHVELGHRSGGEIPHDHDVDHDHDHEAADGG